MTVNATQSSDSDQIPCSTGEVPDHLKNLYSEKLLTVNAIQSCVSDQIPCSTGEVPDHLKNLYSESCQNFNPEQQTKLKQLLIAAQNTFSQSSHDLCRTSLVEYKIDLVPATRPIKQAPYLLPLTKHQDAENEIKLS